MRWSSLLLLAVLLFSFGCIGEKKFEGTKTEQLADSQEFDLDQDGIADYAVYEFSPVTVTGGQMKIQRMVTVTTKTTGTYTSVSPNLTDVDLLIADQSLEEFSQSRIQADTACSNKIGLASVVCSDVKTCSRLCSSASVKCRAVAENYEDELAGAMITYVQANNDIRTLILDSRRMIFDLRETTDEDRNAFLQKTRNIVANIAAINANPLYVQPELQLCEPSDYGVAYLLDAAGKIGAYRTEASGYHYRVMFSVKPLEEKQAGEIGIEIGGVGLIDSLPASAVTDAAEMGSIQKIVTKEQGGIVQVTWNSEKLSEEGYLLVYEFESETPPDQLMTSLKTPTLSVRTIDLSGLMPTNIIFQLFYSVLRNYYIAMGIALGFTLSMLLLFYSFVVMAFTIITEKLGGASLTTGFRKAFGRTEVRWKGDMLISAVFLAVGLAISFLVATQPVEAPLLLESIEFLMQNGEGAVGIACIMLGVVLAYLAVENMAKIIILERTYGMVMKGEKEAFKSKAAALKERIQTLKKLVEEYSKENFDVSQEYDTLATLRAGKIDSMSKDMTARSKALVDEYLSRTDRAISSLEEKKKLADENWPKWKETIAKLLEEQEEVYAASLVTVPASLRSWALSRYSKEEGILLERDAIKKVKVTPEKMVREMLRKGLISGVIVMKNEKMLLSEFAEDGGTVVTALALKLRTYIRSLAKNLGQHEPQSFVAIGQRHVLVLMKNQGMDSILFVKRPKFNEAIEQWKEKMKALEGA